MGVQINPFAAYLKMRLVSARVVAYWPSVRDLGRGLGAHGSIGRGGVLGRDFGVLVQLQVAGPDVLMVAYGVPTGWANVRLNHVGHVG